MEGKLGSEVQKKINEIIKQMMEAKKDPPPQKE